jgi:hypothetical protein
MEVERVPVFDFFSIPNALLRSLSLPSWGARETASSSTAQDD